MTESGLSTNYVYSRPFLMLCASSILFFASFNMIIPELPAYLTSLGGGDYKGLIISLFTLTAMISRPFSGRLTDQIGRVPVIMVGSAVCFVCSLYYPLVSSIYAFFLLRLVHGFSTGFAPTGEAAYLSDIVPANRRGEAMGYLGTASALGMASGPAIGGWISNLYSMEIMFYTSSALALISVLILIGIKETLTDRRRFHPSHLKIRKDDLFEPRVIVPCIVMLLCVYAYGSMLTIIPDYGDYMGIRNKGLLFTYFTLASITVRLLGGKASDRFGRIQVVRVSSGLILVSMLIISLAPSRGYLILGMCLYGMAHGITSPTLLAWATDLSSTGRKGRALASLYIFMELGIGLGALASGWVYGNDNTHFFTTFLISGLLGGVAFTYLWFARPPVNLST